MTEMDSDYYITQGVFMEKKEHVKIVLHHIASNWWQQTIAFKSSDFQVPTFFSMSGRLQEATARVESLV